MNKDKRPPWAATRLGDLRIYSYSELARWVEVATRYQSGSLSPRVRLPSSRFAVVERIAAPELGRVCYFKRYLIRGSWDWVKHQLLRSRAWRAVRGAELLEQHGFNAPTSLCVIERCSCGVTTESILVSEEAAHIASLREALRRAAPAERRKLVQAAAREVGTLHAKRLHHGDLNLGNLLVAESADQPRFIWLDNERVRRLPVALPVKLRLTSLRQLNKESDFLTPADRLSFFRTYRRAAGLTKQQATPLLRKANKIIQTYWQTHSVK